MAAFAANGHERTDGFEKLTGATQYAADVVRPGMLHAKILRSPLPHARIVSIDVERARNLPGVHAVLTGSDFPEYLLGRSMRDMTILALDRVRFVGEKVAAVAAETVEIAEEALALIDVEYEELPAVYDPIAAMQPDAPRVHEPDWVRAHKTPAQNVANYPNSVSNPIYGSSVDDVEAALAAADQVFEHTFHTPVQHQAYLEPHCCLVELDERDVAHIWAANKAPFLLLDYLREGLGMSRSQVEIHIMPLGGDFGGKGSFMDIPLTYFLARATRRPVRLLMTMTEELMAGNPRHSATVIVRSGFDKGGKLLARWTRTYYNSGAYAAFKPAVDATLPRVRSGGLAAYTEVPVWRVEGHMIYTNTVPCGHMRAPGGAQPIHAIEQHTDLCARAMGIDPLDLRLINAPSEPRAAGGGGAGTVPKAREALRTAAAAIGWHDPKPINVGRGIALADVTNSPATDYSTRLIVQRNGDVVLQTPIVEQGSGMLTVFRQMAGEALGIPLDQIRVVQGMDDIEYDRGVGGSRITRIIGKMIERSSRTVQEQLADLVAAEFGLEASQIRIEDGAFHTPDGRRLSLGEAAHLATEDVVALLRYAPQPEDIIEAFDAIAAEVEVDRETGGVHIRRVVSALEVGRIINPIMHQGQIDGGAIQGLGYALLEGLTFEEGRVTNLNLHEYKLPTIADIPAFESIILAPEPGLGITPIGEGPSSGMAAAIANAILDSLGRAIDIPIRAELAADLD